MRWSTRKREASGTGDFYWREFIAAFLDVFARAVHAKDDVRVVFQDWQEVRITDVALGGQFDGVHTVGVRL